MVGEGGGNKSQEVSFTQAAKGMEPLKESVSELEMMTRAGKTPPPPYTSYITSPPSLSPLSSSFFFPFLISFPLLSALVFRCFSFSSFTVYSVLSLQTPLLLFLFSSFSYFRDEFIRCCG